MSEILPLRKIIGVTTAGVLGLTAISSVANAHVPLAESEVTPDVQNSQITYVETDPRMTIGSYGVNATVEVPLKLEPALTAGWQLPDWLTDNITSVKTTAIYNAAKSDGSTPPVVAESTVSFKETKLKKEVRFNAPLMKDRTPEQADLPKLITITVPEDIFEVHSIVPRASAIDGGGLAFKRNLPATKLKELSVDMEWDWLPDDLPLGLKENGVTFSQRLDNMAANIGVEALDRVANTTCFNTLVNQLNPTTPAATPGTNGNLTQPTTSSTAETPSTAALPPFIQQIDQIMKQQAADAYNQNNPNGGATAADVDIIWPTSFDVTNVDTEQEKAQKAYDELKAKLQEKGWIFNIDWPNTSKVACTSSAGISTISDRQSTIDQNANGGASR